MLIKMAPSIYTVRENGGFVTLRLVRGGIQDREIVVNLIPTSVSATGMLTTVLQYFYHSV